MERIFYVVRRQYWYFGPDCWRQTAQNKTSVQSLKVNSFRPKYYFAFVQQYSEYILSVDSDVCDLAAIILLGWGQIDEHCCSNNVGRQKLNHLTSHLNNVETCVINMIIQNLYFCFCQTFQPNKFVRDDVNRN